MKSEYFIEFYDYSFGYGATSRMYLPMPKVEVDMEKALKKVLKRLEKKLAKADITIFAMHETKEGLEDLTMHWAYENMEHCPDIPFC